MRRASSAAGRARRRGRRRLDRLDLYELCVTDGARTARFLRAVHGGAARVLREDFSGTGALARAWAGAVRGGRAVAVDLDPGALARCGETPGVRTLHEDAARCRARADVIAAVNFPVGYWRDRRSLLHYLRAVRASLNPRGVFACDTYGGRDAFSALTLERRVLGPNGERITQEWEQREADPISGMVTDVLHFRVKEPGVARARVLRDAFVYRWRLWSIAELREAMTEAGFRAVEVHDRLGVGIDSSGRLHVKPVASGEGLDENYVVYVVGRR